ncbi:MAG: MerC domain-containing protein [Candidatus Obscuribacterales bacterium]|nr:MerC domain-containing protein [Candidatus Obscuribacterales bacterium]
MNQTKSSGCCGEKGHKHSHGHSHERKVPAGATGAFSVVLGDEVLVSAEESKAHQEHHKKVQTTLLLDNLGIFASTLCLIHCMAMPFIIAFLPFLGLQFLEGELAHRVIALFVFAFAIFAIGPGYMQHRRKQVLFATIFGLLLVAAALLVAGPIFGEQYELPFITTGNLILVITHLRNRKLCQCAH